MDGAINVFPVNDPIHSDEENDNQNTEFLMKWCERYPEAAVPKLNFSNKREAEQYLDACRNAIKHLEEKLNQKKFYLLFVEAYLNDDKKSSQESRGFNSSRSSSFKSENILLNPSLDHINTNIDFEQRSNSSTEKSIYDTDEAQLICIETIDGDTMKFSRNESSMKRRVLSPVLDNGKHFEAQAINSDALVNTFEKNKPNMDETSYIEVWKCSTGTVATNKVFKSTLKENKTLSDMDCNDVFENIVPVKSKPLPPNRRNRHTYEEVWTCSSGEKRVQLNNAEETRNNNFPGRNLSIDDCIEELEKQQEIFFGEIKENIKTESPKPKLRNKGISRNKPARKRNNWRSALPAFEDEEQLEEAVAGQYAQQQSGYSTGADVSHLDNNSDDASKSSDEENNEYPFCKSTIPKRLRDTSPLLRMRRAQTTNERMSVAYSAFQEWSDDEAPMRDRSPLFSMRSGDFQLSDDDGSGNNWKEEEPPSIPKKPLQSHYKDIPVPRSSDIPTPKSVATDVAKAGTSTDGSATEAFGSPQKEAMSHMVDYQKVRSIAEAEKLTMRIWVLNSLLDTEETYLQYLNTLLLYMKPMKATIGTSQPVMSNQDFETLFYRVPELYDLHANFYATLKPRLDTWTADTTVGDLFKKLLSKLSLYSDYLNNYKRAQHTVEKCAKENIQFAQLIESLKVKSRDMKGSAESISLVEVLYKPVERVMRTTLVLQDLLKYTPHRHPDYSVLREVLRQSQIFLERTNSSSTSAFRPRRVVSSAIAAARSADRELIKHGFLVEVAGDGSRKLRHCFLFSDLLLCAKPKNTTGMFHNKVSYECKWYIPLADLTFQAREDSEVLPEITHSSEEELHELSVQAQQLKHDILREQEKVSKEQKTSISDGYPYKSRKEERLKKKLAEIEARLVLLSPDLPLRLYHMQGRSHMFLMSSDYERNEWTEAIMQQQESCFKSFSLTAFEINSLLAACIKQRKLNNIESMLLREDEELLSGYLSVNVHNGHGFLTTCNPYCTLEVDSYGQFQTKARTRACQNTKSPNWNEEFELDVDGAITLRVLCYDKAKETSTDSSYADDVLIAKGKFVLYKKSEWGKGEWIKECILMDDLTICISVKFVARETTLQRLPSQKSNGVFGVKIESVIKRDNDGIPSVVRKCIAEVEKRGLDEVGIYRVSGVASEIQALKEAFDTDRKDINTLLADMDINAIAGVLKLYFRELPEPLFTDTRYKNFIEAATLTDPETKQRTITRLLSDLPKSNYNTLRFLRKHLVNVALNASVNKMTLHNLVTVFGPTLLRPAEDKSSKDDQSIAHVTMMLSALRIDIHSQMDILMYCLQIDEIPDYDVLKRSLSREETTVLSQNRLLPQPMDSEGAANLTSSPKEFSAKPVSPQPRFHPYEEIFIPPKQNAKPQIVPPSRKPRTAKLSQGNERDTFDYYSTDL